MLDFTFLDPDDGFFECIECRRQFIPGADCPVRTAPDGALASVCDDCFDRLTAATDRDCRESGEFTADRGTKPEDCP